MSQPEWSVARTRAGEKKYAELFTRVVRQSNPHLTDAEVESQANAMRAAEARGINPFQNPDPIED